MGCTRSTGVCAPCVPGSQLPRKQALTLGNGRREREVGNGRESEDFGAGDGLCGRPPHGRRRAGAAPTSGLDADPLVVLPASARRSSRSPGANMSPDRRRTWWTGRRAASGCRTISCPASPRSQTVQRAPPARRSARHSFIAKEFLTQLKLEEAQYVARTLKPVGTCPRGLHRVCTPHFTASVSHPTRPTMRIPRSRAGQDGRYWARTSDLEQFSVGFSTMA